MYTFVVLNLYEMYTIKKIANNKGLTIKALAHKIGVAPNTLSRIINGENTTVEVLRRIAESLDVDIKELFASESPTGYIEYKGTVHRITSLAGLEQLVFKIKDNE